MAKKKSMIDKALKQGQSLGAAGGGYLAARFIENTVAGSVGTDTTLKRLGVRVGVPVAAGLAAQSASKSKLVQAAGLGAMVRGAANAGQWIIQKVQAATSSEVQRARQVAQLHRRAQPRQLPAAQRYPQQEESPASGMMKAAANGRYEVV